VSEKPPRYVTFSPKDFIHGPYVDCPKCGAKTFGVLTIGARQYTRRCSECFYPHPHRSESSEGYPLPALKKKVIYVDQFAISNMMKVLNATTKAHQRIDPFWKVLFEKLDTLCKLQLIICPDSHSHRNESLLAPSYEHLRRMYELLSHGVTFYDSWTIKSFQILRRLSVWLGEVKEPELDVRTIVHGEINAWQERCILSIGGLGDDIVEEIRASRDQLDEALAPIFKRWQTEGGKPFEFWYEQERKATARVLVELYQQQVTRAALASVGLTPFSLGSFMPNAASRVIFSIKERMRKSGIPEDTIQAKLIEFLASDVFEDAPYIKISAMLYAAMARQAAAGRKKPPGRGFSADVDTISALLLYCDAMFVDNEMYQFLHEEPIRNEIKKYKTSVFCLKVRDGFLQYLDQIKASAPRRHLQKVEEVYGEDWGRPFTELYKT